MRLLLGDCKTKLKELEDNSIDAIVTDPPYELGFMGKDWDNTGIANDTEMWRECLRVLKPGGYLLSFSGTRTYHRMAVAIEGAGFEIRDMIEWVYGSGFPKSHNIGKAVDRLQGNEREKVGYKKGQGNIPNDRGKWGLKSNTPVKVTKGTSEWEGWGTALKPAHEPICMARKPLSEKTVAENCLKWGVGGINIDGCRVEYTDGTTEEQIRRKYTGSNEGNGSVTNNFGVKDIKMTSESTLTGRFPANLIHDNSEEVRECFPETISKWGKQKGYKGSSMFLGNKAKWEGSNEFTGDSGSASRFFKSIIYQAKASKKERNIGLNGSAIIMVKYSICKDKNTTPEEREVKLLVAMDTSQERVICVSGIESKNASEWSTVLFGRKLMEKYQKDIGFITKTETKLTTTSLILNWLIHLLTNEYTLDVNCETESGTSPVANVEKCNTLVTTINEKMVSALGVKNVVSGTQLRISVKEGSNFHSTVKPIALMEYLINMVSKEGQIILDPFMGSGTTGMACKKLDREFIGIEMMEEYMEIAKARIEGVELSEEEIMERDQLSLV